MTLGFDATTQEGRHVNSIHVPTESNCYAVEVSKRPGGTTQDYSSHICDSIENPANAHAYFYDGDQKESKKLDISSITVKPLYSEHLRDPKKCSLYGGVHPRGVRYVREILLTGQLQGFCLDDWPTHNNVF